MLSDAVNGMIEQIFLNNAADGALDLLNLNIFTEFGTALHAVYNIFLPMALMLVIIYFLVNMIDKGAMLDQMTLEQIWRQCILLIGCALLLTHGYEIVQRLMSFGLSILSDIQGATSIGSIPLGLSVSDIRTGLGIEDNMGGNIMGIIKLFLPFMFTGVFPIIVKAICYMRILEISVRACMIPLSLADFFQNGLHGAGWHSLKAFLAVSLQTGAIYLTLYLNSVILSTVGVSADDSFVTVFLAIWVATIGVLFRSQGLCKEIVGA